MRSVKLLSVAAMALVALMAAPVAEATCGVPKVFASAITGSMAQGYSQVAVSPAEVTPLGDEIGRFWQSSDATLANNFGGTCPASIWWQNNAALNRAINGDWAGCVNTGCAVGNMTVVVEDFALANPAPGIGGDAYFVAWKANETPALLRGYDFGRVAATGTIFDFETFPRAFVASSGRNGMNIEVTMNYADVAPNFHGVTGPCTGSTPATCTNNPVPADEVIVSYDLMLSVGMGDPGRLRTGWTQIATIPYPGAGVNGVFESVACPDTLNDAWIAVGMTFDGGAAGGITSALVGRATRLECNPDLADPQPSDERPKKVKSATPQRTTGGR